MNPRQIFAAWVVLTGVALAVPSPEVQVTARADRQETDYRIEVEHCRITWSVAHSKLNEGIAQYRSECSLPLSEQMSLNARILGSVRTHEAKLHTLFLGSISGLPEASQRLALAARQSPDWDAKSGRPKSKKLNTYVRDLAIRSDLLQEWQKMFSDARFVSAIAGIEKVIVTRAEELPFFQEIHEKGVGPDERLPSSALIWLTLSPLDGAAPPHIESAEPSPVPK